MRSSQLQGSLNRFRQKIREAQRKLEYEMRNPMIELRCGCGYRIRRRVIAGQRLHWTCPVCHSRRS